MSRFAAGLVLLALCPLALAVCDDALPERRAYFGDLHVHTRFSQDANWRMGNSQIDPQQAYRFARGERIPLPPYAADGSSQRSARLSRPLDFMAVTDHAEALDQVRICDDPDYDGPGAWLCGAGVFKRMAVGLAARILPIDKLCPPGDAGCAAAGLAAWRDTVTAAEEHNSACEFSTFIGYEWSGLGEGMANLHRNVIFGNASVLERPVSAREAPTAGALWNALDAGCRDTLEGCEALTIPHNSNLGNGLMFPAQLEPMAPALAEQRQRYDRLVELVQHKGESECYGGPGAADELCSFEKLPYSTFMQKYLPFLGDPPADDSRYVREALREGLRLETQLGQNPYMPGFIGGTDTHLGAGGAVEEGAYAGHHGAQHISGRGDTPQLPDRVEQNPGGLAVLYAEENSRDALYRAMQRREAYATSGPRIQLRFFGGWDYEDDLCERVDLAARGYAGGVPMGGELSATDSDGRAPEFIVTAVADPGTSSMAGGLLQRVQVVKAWVDAQGDSRETIYEVAGSADNGASVDLASCEPQGRGHKRLCTVWRDPDFDASRSAVYYSRVVENPSCRWQQRICAANQVSCADPDTVPEGLRGCCDDTVPRTIQERAWSSPVWYRAK